MKKSSFETEISKGQRFEFGKNRQSLIDSLGLFWWQLSYAFRVHHEQV